MARDNVRSKKPMAYISMYIYMPSALFTKSFFDLKYQTSPNVVAF